MIFSNKNIQNANPRIMKQASPISNLLWLCEMDVLYGAIRLAEHPERALPKSVTDTTMHLEMYGRFHTEPVSFARRACRRAVRFISDAG